MLLSRILETLSAAGRRALRGSDSKQEGWRTAGEGPRVGYGLRPRTASDPESLSGGASNSILSAHKISGF